MAYSFSDVLYNVNLEKTLAIISVFNDSRGSVLNRFNQMEALARDLSLFFFFFIKHVIYIVKYISKFEW